MLIAIIQGMDLIFRKFIFIPVLILLFTGRKTKDYPRLRLLRKVCCVLVAVFLVRCFFAQFIFTPVNYERFAGQGYFPLIRALFYE